MRAVRVKDTAAEIAVRRVLFSFGYRYRLHAAELPGKPDIIFRKRRCVLFVNAVSGTVITASVVRGRPQT